MEPRDAWARSAYASDVAGVDWSGGDYGRTAATLAPAAECVVDAAAVRAGERVLDVGCGTGNATLAAAQRGATALGLDPAAGLVAIAAARARSDGSDARFVVGDAVSLPFADASMDAVLSVFGVIFADDADQAVAELLRVGRRIALATWVPVGPIATAGRLLREALPTPLGDRARWGDAGWLGDLLARHGASAIEVREARLVFTAASPKAWFDEQERDHPVWRWGRHQVSAARWAQLREESIAALKADNEASVAFRSTSRYRVILASSGCG